jgi:phosphotriesterase-related protein
MGAAVTSVETVLGSVDAQNLGVTLVHEHVLVDWIGAELTSRDRYDIQAVVQVVLPHLRRAREQGVRTLLECTPAYLGRDVHLLERLAREAAPLNILTNTGYYGAADDRFVPAHARTASAEALADGWIREREEGIDGTSIRPAFMKIGVDAGPLSKIDAKLVNAAAITHEATGLAIHSHTGDAVAGLAQLDLLESRGVPPSAFVWVHAQNIDDLAVLAGAAARGAWIELDGVGPDTVERHVEMVLGLAERGHLGRVLVSHDAGQYTVGEPDGAAESFRSYETVFTGFLPALRARGMDEAAVQMLLVDNPRSVLTTHLGMRDQAPT